MITDKMLLITGGNAEQGESYQTYEEASFGDLRIEADSGGKILSMIIRGAYDPYISSTPAVGYTDTDGGATLVVRMTGERMLDGKEFVRLMKQIDSPAYGGEYDDEHFLYISNTKNCNVVSPNHFSMPSTPNTFKMTATLAEDINSGGALVPGLQFKYKAGSANSIRAARSGVGEVVMSGTSYSGNVFAGFIHKATAKYMELPIRYDSLSLFAGSAEPSEPYWGRTVAFRLDMPLMSNANAAVFDELECISGVLTRRVGKDIIDESYEITDAVYCGLPCQRILLKHPVGEAMVAVGDYWESSEDDFWEFGDCIILPPERNCIYIRFSDDPDLEGAMEYILGEELLYELAEHETIQLQQKLDPTLASGANIICVCSEHSPEFYTTYMVKE